MSKANLLGPWVRRFLLECLVSERNLARNTQRSYRDTLGLLLPFVARHARKEIDEISVTDISPEAVRFFLRHLEESRKCAVSTRNHRLAVGGAAPTTNATLEVASASTRTLAVKQNATTTALPGHCIVRFYF